MSQLMPERAPTAGDASARAPARPPCPAPANFAAEVARYNAQARVRHWDGPRYRMTYRELGQGPPLILVPGIASTYETYALLLNLLGARFRTIGYDYPGEQPLDQADLRRISHDDLVDDVFALIDHLQIGRVFLVGISFGSTVVLKALHREPRRFPRAAVQGAFAQRDFSVAERWALRLGGLVPGKVNRLPFRRAVLRYNCQPEFPDLYADRWEFYLTHNGLTPIKALAHRAQMLTTLDLRPILAKIPVDVLLIQGNEDRIVARHYFESLKSALPRAQAVLLPTVGHQPHITHAELLARAIDNWLLPCSPDGCSAGNAQPAGCDAHPDPPPTP
jgi:pimeloyl-ACP methyl ester carboxylesterase